MCHNHFPGFFFFFFLIFEFNVLYTDCHVHLLVSGTQRALICCQCDGFILYILYVHKLNSQNYFLLIQKGKCFIKKPACTELLRGIKTKNKGCLHQTYFLLTAIQ